LRGQAVLDVGPLFFLSSPSSSSYYKYVVKKTRNEIVTALQACSFAIEGTKLSQDHHGERDDKLGCLYHNIDREQAAMKRTEQNERCTNAVLGTRAVPTPTQIADRVNRDTTHRSGTRQDRAAERRRAEQDRAGEGRVASKHLEAEAAQQALPGLTPQIDAA
jgi:hypothetical protein